MSDANNKGADQPEHPRSLINAFVVHCLDSVMTLVSVTKISRLMQASVAEQASLCLTWSETPDDTFCRVMSWLKYIFIISVTKMSSKISLKVLNLITITRLRFIIYGVHLVDVMKMIVYLNICIMYSVAKHILLQSPSNRVDFFFSRFESVTVTSISLRDLEIQLMTCLESSYNQIGISFISLH